MFPDGGRLGGAPTNFACHCRQLGGDAYPVSCVGDDDLGLRTYTELERLGVSAEYVQQNATHSTGRVLVSLDGAGTPSYEIIEDTAWDYLTCTTELSSLAPSLDAACFGTLCQRSPVSRKTIRTFLRAMPERSLKILDINLRAPFFSKKVVEDSLQLATILKLSSEELPVLAGYFDLVGNVTDQLLALRKRFALNLIVYTRGRRGSMLVNTETVDENPGFEATAIDSVGAGDAFTAALCTALLKGRPLNEVNLFANEVATFVCQQKGATPDLPAQLIRKAAQL